MSLNGNQTGLAEETYQLNEMVVFQQVNLFCYNLVSRCRCGAPCSRGNALGRSLLCSTWAPDEFLFMEIKLPNHKKWTHHDHTMNIQWNDDIYPTHYDVGVSENLPWLKLKLRICLQKMGWSSPIFKEVNISIIFWNPIRD